MSSTHRRSVGGVDAAARSAPTARALGAGPTSVDTIYDDRGDEGRKKPSSTPVGSRGRLGDPDLKLRVGYLASVLNNPNEDPTRELLGSWGAFFGLTGGDQVTAVDPSTPPPILPGVLPEVLPSDFEPYLRRIRVQYARFVATRELASASAEREGADGGERAAALAPGGWENDGESDGRGSPWASGELAGGDGSARVFDRGQVMAGGEGALEHASEVASRLRLSGGGSDDGGGDDEGSGSGAGGGVAVASSSREKDAGGAGSGAAVVARGGSLRFRSHGSSLVRAMREIPDIYFAEDFDLSRPDTFASACPDDRDVSSMSMVMQEQLSYHLDTIEVHLLREIGSRSESFFRALGVLQELNAAITSACDHIGSLRSHVKAVDARVSESAETVTALHRKRANLVDLADRFAALEAVSEMRADLALLVESHDYPGALDVVDEMRRALAAPELQGLRCLGQLPEALAATVEECHRAMTDEFVRAARMQPGSTGTANLDLDGRSIGSSSIDAAATTEAALAAVRAAAVTSGMGPGAASSSSASRPSGWGEARGGLGPGEDGLTDVEEALLRPAAGLLHGGGQRLAEALRVWGLAAAADARDATRAAVHACLLAAGADVAVRSADVASGGADAASDATAAALRGASAEVFVALLDGATAALKEHFARCALVVETVHRAVGTSGGAGGGGRGGEGRPSGWAFSGRGDGNTEAAELAEAAAAKLPAAERAAVGAAASDAALAVVDAAQGRWAKVLGARGSANARLSLREFSPVVDAVDRFLSHAEALSGRRCLSLRSSLAAQSKAFLSSQHAASASKLGSLLEAETWTAASVPPHFQRLLNALLDAGETPMSQDIVTDAAGASVELGGDAAATSLSLPSGERIVPVSAALLLLQMLAEYVRLAQQLPSLGADAVHRVAELLKVFNSRTCQLVLGAGAMQVSGLRSITAKHLALAQQALCLFLAVIPALRAALVPRLPGPRHALLLQELERVTQDFALHKAEIHAKLVAIMRERLQVHCKRLPTVAATWRSEEGAEEPSDFAKALSKEVGTLRRVIVNLLPSVDRRDIFGKVLDLFDTQLADSLAKLEKTVVGVGVGGGANGEAAGEGGGGGVTREVYAARVRKDGEMLMQTLGTLVNGGDGDGSTEERDDGGTDGDGTTSPAPAPLLAAYLSRLSA